MLNKNHFTKEDNKEVSLLSQLSSKDTLYNAWYLLKKENENSFGLSGLTIKEFNNNLGANIHNIGRHLKNDTYRFSPTRAAVIKKDNGNYRPLQIPEIQDRVVLKAMAILLEDQLSESLIESEGISFAYQKGKGVREAVLKMKSSYLEKGGVILKADIINFFEEVLKDKLLDEQIFLNLKDDTLNRLIRESLSQKLGGVYKLGKQHKDLFKNAGKGIPQGNPLSPLLSNVYLSRFDAFVKRSGYSLIRYADDFVVVFNSKEEADKGYFEIYNFLKENFSLEIHSLESKNGKTDIINPLENELTFLSIKFDGTNIYPGKETVGLLKNRIKKTIKGAKLNDQLLKELYALIKKWIAIYSYLDIERYFDHIDNYLKVQLHREFKRSVRTIKCSKLARNVRVKQHDKSKKSFWRNPQFTNLLPNFIRRKKIGVNTLESN